MGAEQSSGLCQKHVSGRFFAFETMLRSVPIRRKADFQTFVRCRKFYSAKSAKRRKHYYVFARYPTVRLRETCRVGKEYCAAFGTTDNERRQLQYTLVRLKFYNLGTIQIKRRRVCHFVQIVEHTYQTAQPYAQSAGLKIRNITELPLGRLRHRLSRKKAS